MFDLILRDGTLVTPAGVVPGSVAIERGIIAEIGPNVTGGARQEIDCRGLHMLPGVIDCHVHFNEPGRTDWEGLASGSRALAAGGGTTFFDMPLNSSPPVVDEESFDAKRRAMRQNLPVDHGIWGGLIPGNVHKVKALHERGAVGIKAFMCHSGLDEFPAADEATLRAGMQAAAECGALVAVHAEDEATTSTLTQAARAAGRAGIRDYLNSRPVEAELTAISLALAIAAETDCRLHVVHVSSADGVELISAAIGRGVDVTCETCPHYLTLTDEDMERLGAPAKCSPPLRGREQVDRLWRQLAEGKLDFVASDHSPAPPEMKQSKNFFDVWGGIAGCQSLLALLLVAGHLDRGLPLTRIAELTSANVAKRFQLHDRGAILPGSRADVTIVDLRAGRPLKLEDLLYRHRMSPFVDFPIHGVLRRTLVAGRTAFSADGAEISARGEFVRPGRNGDRR